MKLRTKANAVMIAAFIPAAFLSSNAQTTTPQLKTHADSLSYALGVSIGNNLGQSGFGDDINVDMLAQGMKSFMKKEKTLLDDAAAGALINAAVQDAQAKKAEEGKKAGTANLEAGKKFLDENKKKPGVTTLPDGLQYEVIKMGTGPKAKESDKVTVHYHGTLIDGTIFDSSVQRGKPIDWNVNQFIKGWTEALQLMPVGSKWKLFVPGDLAYGEQGNGSVIGPNMTLIFEMELIAIIPPDAPAPAPGTPEKK